ncbi:lipocalin family protein [Nonlabens ponticola]|uniref:Lipocalin n=1 Tax=Nonlabens ponticola TaxID=2496866 RepID=A0A3S9MYQ0_9FLAO|nr:lipocalin family protein [Nonlabens ponticola]AZQ44381.1 lipocalin [Nonlabens ponticola]
MKKYLFTSLFAALLLVGCGTKNAVKQTENNVGGNWTIDSVTYSGNGQFESTLLQDVTGQCFEGSMWYFVANNNRGNYSIEDPSCTTGTRNFIWSVPGSKDIIEGDLLIKPTGDNYKSETDAGYRVNVKNITENSMTWNQSVLVDGRTVIVSMNFRKLAE